MQDKDYGRVAQVRDIDVKLEKMNAERKERRNLENRLKKLTKGLPVSAKVTFNF